MSGCEECWLVFSEKEKSLPWAAFAASLALAVFENGAVGGGGANVACRKSVQISACGYRLGTWFCVCLKVARWLGEETALEDEILDSAGFRAMAERVTVF